MSAGRSPTAHTPAAWILLAHMFGAAVIIGLDGFRLSSEIGAAVLPIAAVTGLIAGLFIAGAERVTHGAHWWKIALVVAAPSLIVFAPVSRSLFQGAYAQTLPGAQVAPVALPIALWLGCAAVIAIGRRLLRAGDLATRGIVVLALAGVIGGIVWAERHVLKSGYPQAHVGATLAIAVLAGIAIRVTRRAGVSPLATGFIALASLGTAAASCIIGLRVPEQRSVLATFGDQSRDLVGLWRRIFDFDRDGSAAILGGGDCDDFNSARHPGATDVPGDAIDQDCDGEDAKPIVTEIAHGSATPQAKLDLATWRNSDAVQATLRKTQTMNVLVITVDALRADMLAPDAPNRADFPTLTKLLDDSVWFTRAIAPATGTDVSLNTLLTGRFDPFQPIAVTLPEALQAGGLWTFAALPAEVLRYAGETMLSRGMTKVSTVFTDWDKADVGDHVSAGATTKEGLAAIGELADKRGFVWLHYFDVHEHHQIKVPDALLDTVHPNGPAKGKVHGYRALLHGIDTEVGRVLAELDAKGLSDKTIVVFASDHGESLGEDPRLLDTHGKVTYAPLVRIPIAIRVPGVPGAQRTDAVSLVDIAPTLIELLGVKSDAALDGQSLVPAILGAPDALRTIDRPLAVHEELQWSVVEWPYQLIVRPSDNLLELYDLEKDPAEKTDLSTQMPDVVSRLKTRYAAFPPVVVDRTPNGRSVREQRARQRPNHAP
jgi:arylsulfatase A-like enzyme